MKRIVVGFCIAAVLAASSVGLRAQGQAQAPAPPSPSAATAAAAFEVASVKPSAPNPGNPLAAMPMVMSPIGGRFTATNVPLRVLVRMAYEVLDFQIVGGPSWQMTSKFDIHAKAEDGFTGSTKEMLPLIQALLADRFKLKAHMETRELPIATLVIARSDGRLGPDLKKSTSDCPDPAVQAQKQVDALAKNPQAYVAQMMASGGKCTIAPILPTGGGLAGFGLRGNGQPMAVLTSLVTQFTGRIVQDRTGLTGLYDCR